MSTGHTFDYTINITTYICYFGVSTDDVHDFTDKVDSFLLDPTRKKRNRAYRVISFTNRKANGLKFISIYFYSNMSITEYSTE